MRTHMYIDKHERGGHKLIESVLQPLGVLMHTNIHSYIFLQALLKRCVKVNEADWN